MFSLINNPVFSYLSILLIIIPKNYDSEETIIDIQFKKIQLNQETLVETSRSAASAGRNDLETGDENNLGLHF